MVNLFRRLGYPDRYTSKLRTNRMAKWKYITLLYGSAGKNGRRWVITAPDATSESKQVGQAEKGRFMGRIWQGMRLLETALEELDADGWELVSTSFSGVFGIYGTAVLRRPATANSRDSES